MTSPAKKIGLIQSISVPEYEKDAETSLEVNRRILIVEDEPEIAKSYQYILNPETLSNVVPLRRSSRSSSESCSPARNLQIPPYELTIAHTGAEAYHYIEEAIAEGRPFSMGFIDVILGSGMDGIELVRQIQKIDQDMYFVFVTAYQDRSVNAINELLGPEVAERWDYLNKPFTDGEIIQKARNAVTHWNLKQEKQKRNLQLAELQRRLLESERLVSVATVARGMGHEFGNILVQIIGRADLAKKKSEREMKEAFDLIIKAGEMASKVLDRFKNLNRNVDGQNDKNLIRLSQPLDDALLLLDHQLKLTNVKVCRTKNDPALVYASAGGLTQVFVNLIINSIYVMKNSSGQIDFSIAKTPSAVEVKVRDYGPGIPEDIIDRVTEPFFTTKGNDGTGLGLAICKEIIEIEHEGKFTIKNHPIKGVEITIELPYPGTQEQKDKNEDGA
ncbi:MAG: hypothetical protein BroJett040_06000 [Oligoflexia bacterium]|nr:MAG: hypothetical protein BroJett040_06000 [Oligoflexia bacterium]